MVVLKIALVQVPNKRTEAIRRPTEREINSHLQTTSSLHLLEIRGAQIKPPSKIKCSLIMAPRICSLQIKAHPT